MVASNTGVRYEELAHHLFSVITHFSLAAPRDRRRRGSDLKEIEFMTLAILQSHGTMIVGDIQRLLGILPAQMSRIIRSLENREIPLIACGINPTDKRKINVCMTDAGGKALWEYEGCRVQGIVSVLHKLSDEDLYDLSRLVEKLHALPEGGEVELHS